MLDEMLSITGILLVFLLLIVFVKMYDSPVLMASIETRGIERIARQVELTNRREITANAWTERLNIFLVFVGGIAGLGSVGFILFKMLGGHAQRQHEFAMKQLELNYSMIAMQNNKPANNTYNIHIENPKQVPQDVFERFLLSSRYIVDDSEIEGTYWIVDKETDQRKLIEVKE